MFSAYLPCVVVEPSHSKRHAGQRRHRRGVAALGGPVPQLVLLEGEPVEPAGDGFLDLGVLDGGAGMWRLSRQQSRGERACDDKNSRCAAIAENDAVGVGADWRHALAIPAQTTRPR